MVNSPQQAIIAKNSSCSQADIPNDSSYSLGTSLRDFARRYNNELTSKVDQLLTFERNFDNTISKYQAALKEKNKAISEAKEIRKENRKLIEENQKLKEEILELKEQQTSLKAHTESFSDVVAKGNLLFESLSIYSAAFKYNANDTDSKRHSKQHSAAENEAFGKVSIESEGTIPELKKMLEGKKQRIDEKKVSDLPASKHARMKLLWDEERTKLLERINERDKVIEEMEITSKELKDYLREYQGSVVGGEKQRQVSARVDQAKLRMVSKARVDEEVEHHLCKASEYRSHLKYLETIAKLEKETANLKDKLRNLEPIINAMAAIRTEHYQKAEELMGSLSRTHDEGALLTAGTMAYYGGDGLVDEALLLHGYIDGKRWGEMFQDRYKRKPGTFADMHPLLQRSLNCAATIKAVIPVNSGIRSGKERSAARKTIHKIEEISDELGFIEDEIEAEKLVIHLEELMVKIVQLDVKKKH